MKRLQATFHPQAWVNETAVDIESGVEFDATEEFLVMSLQEIHRYREADYSSDNLACNLDARNEHTGPFEVTCEVDEWLEAHGVDDRKKMTQEDLDRLRAAFGIETDKPKAEKVPEATGLSTAKDLKTRLADIANGARLVLRVDGLPDGATLDLDDVFEHRKPPGLGDGRVDCVILLTYTEDDEKDESEE